MAASVAFHPLPSVCGCVLTLLVMLYHQQQPGVVQLPQDAKMTPLQRQQ